MDFMAWLQQEDMDLTYLQVFELWKQETGGAVIQIPSSSYLSPLEWSCLGFVCKTHLGRKELRFGGG